MELKMITTFYTKEELAARTVVKDDTLNELFQQIRAVDPRIYLSERYVVVSRSGILKWKKYKYRYEMLINNGYDIQVFNFPPDDDKLSSINTWVPRSVVMAYFYGLLNTTHLFITA